MIDRHLAVIEQGFFDAPKAENLGVKLVIILFVADTQRDVVQTVQCLHAPLPPKESPNASLPAFIHGNPGNEPPHLFPPPVSSAMHNFFKKISVPILMSRSV
jgi:hypothetical protein